MKRIATFVLLAFSISLQAQLPKTDLYLFEIDTDAMGDVHVHSPKFLNDFNKNNYNNQASFINEHELFITGHNGRGNTDIYLLNTLTKSVKQFTATDEGEYSPTLMPNYQDVSCIRVNENNDQHLWSYPLSREDEGNAIIEELTNVGYHVWLKPDMLAMFLVNDPVQLAIVNLPDGQPSIIQDNIGRTLLKNNTDNLLYVHKYDDSHWYIKEYSPISRRNEIVVQTLPDKEDFTYMQNGTLLMGDGSKLYRFRQGQDESWELVLDLSVYGINNITRLAV
ncbi:MAG: hypothetical protein AAGK97_09275, partial [Bacteroidota bacterium]